MKKVLLLASGLSAEQIKEYNYKDRDWTIVAVNNGWLAAPEKWDYWIRSNDYKGLHPHTVHTHQIIVKEYGSSLAKYGGQVECGFSITLNAGYWALWNLKPNVIGFLGADMNYKPDESGKTHIYGKGYDIIKNGIPDPDRMANLYGKGDPNYLEKIYGRLEKIAKTNNCELANLSHSIDTRLPYKRQTPNFYK